MTGWSDAATEAALAGFEVGRWAFDMATGETVWDARMKSIVGRDEPVPPEAWIGEVVHVDDRPRATEDADRTRGGGAYRADPVRIVRPDGEVRWLRIVGEIELRDGGARGVGAAMDVTDHVRLQQRLAEAERLETLGRFSAGISHNFNNMLMVIGSLLEEIRGSVEDAPGIDPQTHEDVASAIRATERAARVVRELASLTKMETTQVRVVEDVAETCRHVAELTRRILPPGIRLEVDVAASARTRCAPGAIEQVVQNLLHNARDALMGSATRAGRITLQVREATHFGARWVEVLVSDDGPGVPEEMVDTLFEPFVTTKGAAGTGLGLASSAAIAERLGGHLGHRPREGGGAEFLFMLPAADAPEAPETAAPPDSGEQATGDFALVVDDEELLLRTVTKALRRAGFEVEAAATTAETLEVLARCGPPDVVLLDRSVDDASGLELLDAIEARAPDASVYFFTGEGVDPEDAARVAGVIEKPSSLATIVRRLRERSRSAT